MKLSEQITILIEEQKKTNELLERIISFQESSLKNNSLKQQEKIIEVFEKINPELGKILKGMI